VLEIFVAAVSVLVVLWLLSQVAQLAVAGWLLWRRRRRPATFNLRAAPPEPKPRTQQPPPPHPPPAA
jgi:uncharacterized iron-regulated membrane protein